MLTQVLFNSLKIGYMRVFKGVKASECIPRNFKFITLFELIN